jgi:hypothetical protein
MADPLKPAPGAPGQSGQPPALPDPSTPTAAVQRRFGLAYFLLAIVVGVTIGLVVVFLGRPGSDAGSSARPDWLTEHGTAAAQQIARNIGGRYRLPNGTQLVAIAAGPPQIAAQAGQDVRISRIAVRPGNVDDHLEDIELFGTDKTMLYILCGIGAAGQQCSIPGTPSTERAMLLRREGLELALYTFKYLSDVDSVLAFMPPPAGQPPSSILYFRRSDLESEMKRPVTSTLAERRPLTPNALSAGEQGLVRRLTLPNPETGRVSGFYQYQFQQSPDGTAIIVLAPLAA